MRKIFNSTIVLFCFLLFCATNSVAQYLDDSFDITTSGIMAQKVKLNIIAQNVANVATMKDETTGKAYQKQYVRLQATNRGVRVVGIEKSEEPFGRTFDPSSPDADERGFLYIPNVDLPYEMMNLNYTEMVYEANVSVLKTTKTMYQQAIEILK